MTDAEMVRGALPLFMDHWEPKGAGGCSRWMGDATCEKPAVEHVIWTEDTENGLACEEHWQEAKERWGFYDHHPFGGFCNMPGVNLVWSWEEPPGMCVLPLSDEGVQDVLVAMLKVPEPALVPAYQEPTHD